MVGNAACKIWLLLAGQGGAALGVGGGERIDHLHLEAHLHPPRRRAVGGQVGHKGGRRRLGQAGLDRADRHAQRRGQLAQPAHDALVAQLQVLGAEVTAGAQVQNEPGPRRPQPGQPAQPEILGGDLHLVRPDDPGVQSVAGPDQRRVDPPALPRAAVPAPNRRRCLDDLLDRAGSPLCLLGVPPVPEAERSGICGCIHPPQQIARLQVQQAPGDLYRQPGAGLALGGGLGGQRGQRRLVGRGQRLVEAQLVLGPVAPLGPFLGPAVAGPAAGHEPVDQGQVKIVVGGADRHAALLGQPLAADHAPVALAVPEAALAQRHHQPGRAGLEQGHPVTPEVIGHGKDPFRLDDLGIGGGVVASDLEIFQGSPILRRHDPVLWAAGRGQTARRVRLRPPQAARDFGLLARFRSVLRGQGYCTTA